MLEALGSGLLLQKNEECIANQLYNTLFICNYFIIPHKNSHAARNALQYSK